MTEACFQNYAVVRGESLKVFLKEAILENPSQIAQELGVKRGIGVVVTEIQSGSAAAEAMIRTGDVIRQVDRKPVNNVNDFIQVIDKSKGKKSFLLIQRGQNSPLAAVTPRKSLIKPDRRGYSPPVGRS